MKIVYIATALTEVGDAIQENAYTDAEVALNQAIKMCDDINRNTELNARPDVMPIELYEDGDVPSANTFTTE
jgi:hypothetical protein